MLYEINSKSDIAEKNSRELKGLAIKLCKKKQRGKNGKYISWTNLIRWIYMIWGSLTKEEGEKIF